MWDRYERLGATRFNAFTDHESTVYLSIVPKSSVAQAVALEAERLRAPLQGVTDEDLAVERDVVRNELLQRNERNLDGGLLSWSAQALFPPDHRYHREVGGTAQTVAAIARRDIAWYAASQYRPRNATLTVVGDVSKAEILAALAQAGLGDGAQGGAEPLPDQVDVPLEPPEPPPGSTKKLEGTFGGPRVWIAWSLPGTYGSGSAFGEVIPRVLNATVDTKRLQGLGGAAKDITQIAFFTARGLMASTLFAEAHLREGRAPEDSARAVVDAVAKLSTPTPGRTHLGTVYHSLMGVVSGMVMQTEDLLVRATLYAEADRVTGDPHTAQARLGAIAGMESDSFQSFLTAYLTPGRARVAVVSPRKDRARVLPVGLEASPTVRPAATRTTTDSSTPPVARLPSPAEVRRLRLDNGLQVVLWPRPAFPSVTAALVFPGGTAAANPPGAEFFLDQHLPLSYCGGPPSARGITVQTAVLPDVVVDLARGGSGQLSAILLALAQRAAAYRFDHWAVLEGLRAEQCSELSVQDERTRFWSELVAEGKLRLEQRRLAQERSSSIKAMRALGRALFAGTMYEPASPNALTSVSAEDLDVWHASSRRPEQAVLLIAGKIDLAQAEKLARGWFTSWRPEAPPRAARVAASTVPDVSRPPRLFRVVEPGADQAELLLACQLPSRAAEETAANRVFARLLERDLRVRLRDELGATYGVHSDLLELKVGSTMLRIFTDSGARAAGHGAERVLRAS